MVVFFLKMLQVFLHLNVHCFSVTFLDCLFLRPMGNSPTISTNVGLLGCCLAVKASGYCIAKSSYLVDPASSHMLVSKIKPCMSKYKQSIQ